MLLMILLLSFGIVWVASVIACKVMLHMILNHTKITWSEFAKYSSPYRPQAIMQVMCWMPLLNTKVAKELWDVYKEAKQEMETERFEELRKN
jgi:hypothetical protein